MKTLILSYITGLVFIFSSFTASAIKPPSSNASLSAISVSTGTALVNSTGSSTVNYTTSVSPSTMALTVKSTTSDANATITVNGTPATSGANSQSIALNAMGTTFINVIVTAQDGTTTRSYGITVSKNGSSNASLSNITVNTGALVNSTGSSTVNYTTSVSASTTSIMVKPVAADATATITVNGVAVASGAYSQSVPLNATGTTFINTIVTAQDGVTQRSYGITVSKTGSNNASLSNISVSTGPLVNSTGSSTVNYTTSVSSTTTSLTVTPTASDVTATITVNGVVVSSGSASQNIALNATGTTFINTIVTAQDGTTTRSYGITVSKNGSSNANLSNISVNTGTLTSSTGSSTVNYTTSVSASTTSIMVKPVAADATATITVNGVAVASGAYSQSVPLNATGTTFINTIVTAQDGLTQRSYGITVSKTGSNNASLSNISVSNGATLVNSTGSSTVNYTTSVSPTTTSLTVTPTASDATAIITVNGVVVSSGSASQNIALNATGTTFINTIVTAQDGTTTRSYGITVSKNGSSNASLSNLTISTGTLTSIPGTNNYTTTVGVSVASATVTPTASDVTAAIQVNGTAVNSGTPSQPITLTPGGSTTVGILVTAQDGTTTKYYTINVKRTGQNSYTWTGAADTKWSNDNNWSPTGHPVAGDEAIIPTTSNTPTVDVASACASITISGTTTLTLTAPLTVSASTNLSSNLTVAGAAIFSGAQLNIAGNSSISNTFTNNSGATSNFTSINISTNGRLTNNGNITASAAIFVDYLGGIANSGTFTSSASNISLQTNAFINNLTGGTLNITNSPSVNMLYQAVLGNQGTVNISGSTIHMGNSGYIENSPGATFTINGGSVIDFAANSAATSKVQNDGTFFAGTTNSPVTINLNYPGALLKNTSLFTLSVTSVINLPADNSQISNTGTFTLLSDITGSATIGAVTGNSAHIDGTYDVQRFISGTGADNSGGRGYRLLSSPVYATTTSVGNIYSLNYAAALSPTSGSGGTAGGFDETGNPTIYLFRGNLPQSNATFTSGNFRGVASINNAPTYTIDGDVGNFNLPVANGFLFFFRGNKSTNKFTPGVAAESVTYDQQGTMNVGPIVSKPWFTSLSTLDYSYPNTAGTEFALVGNPYPSSIDWDTYTTSVSTSGISAPNVNPSIYILQGSSGNYNTYKAGTGGFGTIAATNSNIIPSGQGFFVQADATGASITFNETAKVNTQVVANNNLFLGKPVNTVVNQFLNLKLQKDSAVIDGILVNFNSTAKAAYVANEDARYKLGTGLARLSSRSADNIDLAINTLALPEKSVTIPLTVTATNDGLYQLNMAAIKSIPELYEIWLMDATKKDSVDMRHTATYSFTLSKSDSTGRFSLVIRQNPALAMRLINFDAARAKVGAQIVWNTVNEANFTNFTVERSINNGASFDVLGGYLSSGLGTYSYTDNAPVKGANEYRLRLEDVNGAITYSRIVTLMVSNAINGLSSNNINVYPNPSNGIINLDINQSSTTFASLDGLQTVFTANTTAAGSSSVSYLITVANITGAVVKTATSSSASWQDNVANLSPGTYFIRVVNKSNNTLVGRASFVKL